jgi:hypothetical protein
VPERFAVEKVMEIPVYELPVKTVVVGDEQGPVFAVVGDPVFALPGAIVALIWLDTRL